MQISTLILVYCLLFVFVCYICYKTTNINIQIICLFVLIYIFQEIKFFNTLLVEPNKKVSFNDKINVLNYNSMESFDKDVETHAEVGSSIVSDIEEATFPIWELYDKTTTSDYKKYANNLNYMEETTYNKEYSSYNSDNGTN